MNCEARGEDIGVKKLEERERWHGVYIRWDAGKGGEKRMRWVS